MAMNGVHEIVKLAKRIAIAVVGAILLLLGVVMIVPRNRRSFSFR